MLMKNSKILVVGTVSNVANTLNKNFKSINRALSDFKSVNYFLVESDSSDATLRELSILREQHNINYLSLGELSRIIPNRVERIRHCRNAYINHLREIAAEIEFNYVLVIDLDGIANKVSKKGIRSCFEKQQNWDVCFSNQFPYYYDIYALRAKGWNDSDPFKDIEVLKNSMQISKQDRLRYWKEENSIRQKILYSKMRFIKPWHDWVAVESAFGGLGIYKTEIFLEFDYSCDFYSEANTCEHVTLHHKLFYNSKKMFINPRLITSYFNSYSLNKYRVIRFMRYLVSLIQLNSNQRRF
jgi:hypothetical protein